MSEYVDPAAKVNEALEMFEFGLNGFREYKDVTPSASKLQLDLIDHLEFVGNPSKVNTLGALRVVAKLNDLIEKDFESLEDLDYEDEIIAWGEGLVMTVGDDAEQGILPISDGIRVHGKVFKPAVLEVPVLESIIANGDFIDDVTQPLIQMSAVLELEYVSIENTLEGSEYFDLPSDERIYLPLAYAGMRIKRRVDAEE